MPDENNIQEVTNKSRVEQLLEAWAGGDQIELWAPQSNIERILMNILGATGVDINPIQSRNEALLLQILENGGGSGGGDSSDIELLHIDSVTLCLDKTWQEIHDSLADGIILVVDAFDEDPPLVISSANDDLHGSYVVSVYYGDQQPELFHCIGTDEYPVLDA